MAERAHANMTMQMRPTPCAHCTLVGQSMMAVYSPSRRETRLVCKPCGSELLKPIRGLAPAVQETPEYMAKRLIRITNLLRVHLRRLNRYDAVAAQRVEQELLSALEELAPVVGFYASRSFLLQTLDLVMEYAETQRDPKHFSTERELRAMLAFMTAAERVLKMAEEAVELLELSERAEGLSLAQSNRRRHHHDDEDRYAERHQDKEVRTLTPSDAAAVERQS